MKINFNGKVKGIELLTSYATQEEPDFNKEKKRFEIEYSYDKEKITEDFLNALQQEFQKEGYTYVRSAKNRLWISEPLQFNVSITDVIAYNPIRADFKLKTENIDDQSIRTVTLEKRIGFRTKQLPVYSFTPFVDIYGNVSYESMGKIEPTPVINILNRLGYAAGVVPTPIELEEFMQKIMEKHKK